MGNYELLYILPAKYTEGELKELTGKIDGIVKALGGTISETHNLGSRRLSYPINHERNGVYILTYFTAEPSVAPKLNDTLRLSTDLLRHVVVTRNPAFKTLPNFTEMEEAAAKKRAMRHEENKASMKAAAPIGTVMSMEDIDKKIDAILTEEVK
jgi:small subunit ribosomal protein S6